MCTIEDRALIWRFNRGDPGAMRRIYEKHRMSLMRVASALLRDRNFVEDVVHDVFVSFAQTAGSFELRGSLKAYLAVCVANRARDVNRSQRRRGLDCEDQVAAPTARPDPEMQTMRHEVAAALESALAELPEEQREVVVLHLLGEFPFRQIAKSQGISVNTAGSRYRYGIEKLRGAVNGSGRNA